MVNLSQKYILETKEKKWVKKKERKKEMKGIIKKKYIIRSSFLYDILLIPFSATAYVCPLFHTIFLARNFSLVLNDNKI